MRLDRLRQEADFLMTLRRDGWDFGCWYTPGDEYCGSTACAVGHCPQAFPDDWEIRGGLPRLKITPAVANPIANSHPSLRDAAYFFELNNAEAMHLFVPCEQYDPWLVIPEDASPADVASLIYNFIGHYEKGDRIPDRSAVNRYPELHKENL